MKSNTKPPLFLFSKLIGKRHFVDLLTACATSHDNFQCQYVPMAERLAKCVQDLPLCTDTYNRPGGALQFGLQAGLLAVRFCDAVIFAPKATAQERQHQDPQYRWCAYCAALASAYLMCAGQVEVVLESGEAHSFAGRQPLGNVRTAFEAQWRTSPALPQQAGLIYLQGFFFPGQFSHLSPALLAELCGAINPAMATTSNESPLARVVRMSLSRVLEAQRQSDAKVIEGTAPAPMTDLPPEAVPAAQTTSQTSPATAPAPNVSASTARQVDAIPTGTPAPATATPSVSEPAPVEPSSAPLAPESGQVIDPKVVEWVRALANNKIFDNEVQVTEQGVFFSRKALAYGDSPIKNFAMLYGAGVVIKKELEGALCNLDLAAVYAAALAKVKPQ